MTKTMKTAGLALALVGLGLALAGCGNTLSGAKQDAATDTQTARTAADQAAAKTTAAAQQAGQAVKSVPTSVDAATVVTPEVKAAILRDPVLNDPHNLVNVSSHDHQVRLTGHVQSASMKQRATEDAQVVTSKHHGGDFSVSNELTVGGG